MSSSKGGIAEKPSDVREGKAQLAAGKWWLGLVWRDGAWAGQVPENGNPEGNGSVKSTSQWGGGLSLSTLL